MDRGLPWREMIQRPQEDVEVAAMRKEYEKWCKWESARPLGTEEAASVLRDPVLRRRILRSRNAYRDKRCGRPPLQAKCRTVAIGCQDPDLMSLQRNSPTAHRLSMFVVLQFFSSRRRFPKEGWKLLCGDVTAAFLRGTQKGTSR